MSTVGNFGPLDSSFKRLGALPQTMNYRGQWSASVTYFKNDVAFDATANNSYVLINTSKTGGSRPGLDISNWSVLSPGGGGSASAKTNSYVMGAIVVVPDSGATNIITINFTTTVVNANIAFYPNFHLINTTNSITANVILSASSLSSGLTILPSDNSFGSFISIPKNGGQTDVSMNTPFFISCTAIGSYSLNFSVSADVATSGNLYIPDVGAAEGYVIAVGPIV